MPSLYILILNYKTWHDTLECLKSLFGSTFLSFQAVVLDNDSPEKKWELLTDWAVQTGITSRFYTANEVEDSVFHETPEQLLFIQNDRNDGFAAGNNFFLRSVMAQERHILLLNPDMTVQPQMLDQMMTFAATQPPRTLTGARVHNFFRPDEVLFYGGSQIHRPTATVRGIRNKNQFNQLDYISGGCLLTHTTHLQELGLLPENYFLYWEETDWCQNALQKGYQLAVCAEAIAYDKGGTSIGRGFLAEYYYTRNGLHFTKKYNPAFLISVCFFNVFRFFKRLLARRMDKAKGVWRGTIDFLRNRSGKLVL
jgi:GT2 family glycosyltransferase